MRNHFELNEKWGTLSEDGLEKYIDIFMYGNDKNPTKIIRQVSKGDSSLRSYTYVISNGTQKDIDEIEIERIIASEVESKVRDRSSDLGRFKKLQKAHEILKNIKYGDSFEDFSEAEKEMIKFLKEKFDDLFSKSNN